MLTTTRGTRTRRRICGITARLGVHWHFLLLERSNKRPHQPRLARFNPRRMYLLAKCRRSIETVRWQAAGPLEIIHSGPESALRIGDASQILLPVRQSWIFDRVPLAQSVSTERCSESCGLSTYVQAAYEPSTRSKALDAST